jgi:uncharacterized protein (TIGR00251 family)
LIAAVITTIGSPSGAKSPVSYVNATVAVPGWGITVQYDRVDLEVRLQPRAGRNEIVGMRDGRLVVRVAAPPVDDRANRALCKLIAKRAGVARGRVSVVRGERSRDKVVRVEGAGPGALRRSLGMTEEAEDCP